MSTGIGSADPSSESGLGFRNPRIQRLRRLVAERSERRSSGLVVVEGEVLIREALDAGWACEEEFVAIGTDPITTEDANLVAPGVLDRVASTETTRPHMALFAVPEPRALTDMSTVLVADRLSDPGNLGTVIRSAEAAGFDAVVVTPGTVDDLSPKVVRASAGARFHVPVLERPLEALGESGFTLIASSSHRGTAHLDLDWATPDRLALVLGNEAHGVDESAPVHSWVRIAHGGRAESLNVAMASSILCFAAAQGRGLL